MPAAFSIVEIYFLKKKKKNYWFRFVKNFLIIKQFDLKLCIETRRGEAFAGHLKLSDRKDNIWNQA